MGFDPFSYALGLAAGGGGGGGGGTTILTGTTDPAANQGSNGGIYLKTATGLVYDSELNWSCKSEYYVSDTTQRLSTQSDAFYKTVQGGAIAVQYHYGKYYGPVLISTVKDYVKYNANTNPTGSYTLDGTTWYVSTTEHWDTSQDTPTIPRFEATNPATDYEYVVTTLLSLASYVPGDHSLDEIVTATYAKVNGVWQPLIGTNTTDINL